ncbi:MAG: hypothetical protein IJW30_00805 [Clostridia bacterium]|nr:hypothetical protein [Clostridia bacterium]
MKAYFITLVSAALVAALIGILSPDGERGGIAKHVRLLTALFLLCVLISPLKGALEWVQGLQDAEVPFLDGGASDGTDYDKLLAETMDEASRQYFAQSLTETLLTQFSMKAGTVRCAVQWETAEDGIAPRLVTVFLSGESIWKNPHEIEAFVEKLLSCPCETVVE